MKRATEAYDVEVFRNYSNRYPTSREFAGVIGVYDKGPKIFDFQSSSTVRPELEQGYVVTGEARRSADPIIRVAKVLMFYAWGGNPNASLVEKTWARFSPKLIGQFCARLLLSLPQIESSVSERMNIYRVDKSGWHEYGLEELFPSWPVFSTVWPTIARTALAEISPKDIVAFDKAFGVIPGE